MRYGDISSFQSGVAVPLFSLRSHASIGIGDFLDLIPFARWASLCNFDIIQLLPVNDTGSESNARWEMEIEDVAFCLFVCLLITQTYNGPQKRYPFLEI